MMSFQKAVNLKDLPRKPHGEEDIQQNCGGEMDLGIFASLHDSISL